jgi:hypothetical protein
MPLYRPTLDGAVTIYTYSINIINHEYTRNQLNMSPPIPSRLSQTASVTSRTAHSDVQFAPTSTRARSTQYSLTSTANGPPVERGWQGASQTNAFVSKTGKIYRPIQHYVPPMSTNPPGSLGSLTQRKRPAGPAASFKHAKISRGDSRHNSPPTMTDEDYAEATIVRLVGEREAEFGAEEEAKATAEAQRCDECATALYHRETPQAIAQSESSAHASRVSAIDQGYEREQSRAGSTRLGTEQSRIGSLYKEHIPMSVPRISTYSARRYAVPPWAYEFGAAEGRDWINGKDYEVRSGMIKPGRNRYVVEN